MSSSWGWIRRSSAVPAALRADGVPATPPAASALFLSGVRPARWRWGLPARAAAGAWTAAARTKARMTAAGRRMSALSGLGGALSRGDGTDALLGGALLDVLGGALEGGQQVELL